MSFSNCQMAHHDASRFVIRYGVFEHATTENALAVLEEAIKNHGKPTSITTDRRSQFYANTSEVKRKGASVFEKKMVKLGIKQILAGLRHSHTNGKMEILHGKIQLKLPEFEAIIMHKSDPATYLWNGTTTGDCTCLLV